jgi:hypothetical protein
MVSETSGPAHDEAAVEGRGVLARGTGARPSPPRRDPASNARRAQLEWASINSAAERVAVDERPAGESTGSEDRSPAAL